MKFLCWNVNGWRAIGRKGGYEWLAKSEAEIIGLQEIKAEVVEMPLELQSEYEWSYSVAEKKGYAGTMLLVKKDWAQKKEWRFLDKLTTENKNDEEILNAEGRICVGEFNYRQKKALFINCYFPNGGMGEERLKYKMDFYAAFAKAMREKRLIYKYIVICGDVNTAHSEIDLARPSANSKNTGFLPMEREWVSEFLADGFIDSFRQLHSEEKDAYSWWDYKTRARERNVGWRIDYFLLSDNMKNLLQMACIEKDVLGSDHAPVTISLLA